MITKKKLKTRFDYQIRTLGLCTLLLLVFTMLFINPQIQEVNNNNESLKEEIKIEENNNNTLKFEQSEIVNESIIKGN